MTGKAKKNNSSLKTPENITLLLIIIVMDGQKNFWKYVLEVWLVISWKTKHYPKQQYCWNTAGSHHHKYAAQKHTKIHDSIQITETTFEQKKCSKIKLQQKFLVNEYNISSLMWKRELLLGWIHGKTPICVYADTAEKNDTHWKTAVVETH
jgi:hypothetical protein